MRPGPAIVPLFAVISIGACRRAGPPFSPADSLAQFRIEPGFRVELFASEPQIISPAAMEFDESGRIYVVEHRGYPLDTQSRLGRIRLLEDTDNDGKPDRSTVFAEGLTMPTGVMRWKKGILVTDAPDLIYLEDSNQDGRSDVRRTLLTGFPFTNPQHTLNAPVYGLDNWIYLANPTPTLPIIFKDQFNLVETNIRFPDRPDIPPLKDRGRNVRLRPDTFELESLSGVTQFGHAFDEWGHHFVHNNSNHIRHEVLAARYLKRNSDLAVASVIQDISDHGPAAAVFPIAPNPRFELLTNVGQFTSACGLTLYLGGAFPASLGRSAFVGEPAHNLVHRDILTDAGATFVAKRAHENSEFLASTDHWFRPVNFTVGPDGALYVIDYYRLVIEHPEWMATSTYTSTELKQGVDRGRIYRIVPDGGLPLPKGIRLGSASDRELVAYLAHPNLWWRRTAQRLLMDRRAVSVVPDLLQLIQTGPPLGRLHALWTLEGLGRLDSATIDKALADPEPGLRKNALILAERRPELSGRLLRVAEDASPKVRFQLLATLGSFDTPAAKVARDRLLFTHFEDRWFQMAALSASSEESLRLFRRAIELAGNQTPGGAAFFTQASSAIASRRNAAEIQQVIQTVARGKSGSPQWWAVPSLRGLSAGLGGRRSRPAPLAGREHLLAFLTHPEKEFRRAALQLLGTMGGLPQGSVAVVRKAEAVAEDRSADPELRADALTLLAMAGAAGRESLWKQLISPQEPDPVGVAATRALGSLPGPEIGKFLLANWRTMSTAIRSEACDAMLDDTTRLPMLVSALKDGTVQPWTMNFRQKRRLIMHSDPAIRAEARSVLEQGPGQRQSVLTRYEAALHTNGNAGRGKLVFESACAKCHRFHGSGAPVGPDLATIQNQPKKTLLASILMPNESIAQGYETYVVETASGGRLDGVIGSQTPTTIVLLHEDGKEDVIQRRDIKGMYVTNLSAMPEDLEKQISIEQMSDLLEYLKTTH